jgi:hypothetical protein
MTDTTKSIIDYAYDDNAKDMRDALYSDIQDRVMAHIDAKKQEIARTLIVRPEVPEEEQEEEQVENT